MHRCINLGKSHFKYRSDGSPNGDKLTGDLLVYIVRENRPNRSSNSFTTTRHLLLLIDILDVSAIFHFRKAAENCIAVSLLMKVKK